MSPINLAEVLDPAPPEPSVLDRINAAAQPDPARLVFESARAAVARECGQWGSRRESRSDYERDALVQAVCERVWANPIGLARLAAADKPLRFTTLRNEVRSLLRDSRGWLDSVDGWQPRPGTRTTDESGKRLRASGRVPVLESVKAQADYWRERERAGLPPIQSSLETLTDAYVDESGCIDWAAIDNHRQRELDAGESLPPAAAAEHSRELAAVILDRIAADWQLTPRDRERVFIALLVAGGERVRVLADVYGSADKVKKSANAGRKLLSSRAIDPDYLAATRRRAAADLGLVEPEPEPEPDQPLIAAAAAAVERAIGRERERAGNYLSGGGNLLAATKTSGHGSPAAVLAYIARVERVLASGQTAAQERAAAIAAAPAHTLDCTAARPLPNVERGQRVLSAARTAALPCWQPQPDQRTRATQPEISRYARQHWPDRVIAGQPGYTGSHPATRRESWQQTAAAATAADPAALDGRYCPLPAPAAS